MNNLKQNDLVRVNGKAPYHSGREGYFQFLTDKQTAVITHEPLKAGSDTGNYFAVNPQHLEKL